MVVPTDVRVIEVRRSGLEDEDRHVGVLRQARSDRQSRSLVVEVSLGLRLPHNEQTYPRAWQQNPISLDRPI